ncbi:MAG: bifunctional demethylmenaquinone methyltransferase/2-methoxy-6-polyprenyl-1,4-benzoquinol methylase UbiE [Bdellovibrionales bacterium]
MSNPEENWFGYAKAAGAGDKTRRVKAVFESVADNYDIMNDLMSLGMHRLWKRTFVRHVAPVDGEKILDVAGGTGDIAFLMKKRAPKAAITVCDINPEMLRVGKNRAIDKGFVDAFKWVEGNAESLPFPARQFDVLTIAFGLRNVARIDDALADFARVLKPGGRFLCLEFAPVDKPVLKEAYDAYSFTLLPFLGRVVANDADSYQYLAESIRKFPKPEALAKRIAAAGFVSVTHTGLAGGIVNIHEGIRV